MDILGGGLVGRPAEEIGKLFDVADILGLSLGAEPADRHVLDQSPAYRTDGLVGHWGLLSWVRFKAPQSQDRTPASATPRDPSLATNYRGSGLVHRRFLVVQACPGKGRVSTRLEPFAAVVARAASGHDGLNAFRRRSRPTSTSRKATSVPPHCVPCGNLGDAVSIRPGSQ